MVADSQLPFEKIQLYIGISRHILITTWVLF
jgi:hypothetical protein